MKTTIKLEEIMMLASSLLLFHQLDFSWMWFCILFLMPDTGLLGYIINKRTGAITYNLFHHKGIALLVYATGDYFSINQLEFSGILIFAHSSFDRIWGYGLKYSDGFRHTHLGMIGNQNK